MRCHRPAYRHAATCLVLPTKPRSKLRDRHHRLALLLLLLPLLRLATAAWPRMATTEPAAVVVSTITVSVSAAAPRHR